MIRFVLVIILTLPIGIYYVMRCRYIAKHMDRYPEIVRYRIAQKIFRIIRFFARTRTDVYGEENLPEDGGYVMYSNHQGKYDVLGIIMAHKKPCKFIVDEARSRLPYANEITMILEGKRLDKTDLRQQARIIRDVINQVKEGARYVIFPEGGYTDNHNNLQEFHAGTFRCSVKSKTPIVPVAIKDSYKVFGVNSLRKVRTEVHFLKPILFEEYEGLSTNKVAELVKSRINEAMQPV